MAGGARASDVLRSIRGLAVPSRLEGMARFGIETRTALGVTVTELRGLARGLGRDHELAADLWACGIHEARILASIVDDPAAVTEEQMETWLRGFDSWDLCDQACGNLFDRTPFAFDKALEWSVREPEFEKRAGFALMATSAVHRRDWPDRDFHVFLPRIRAEATDERNYVKKAVSWALRQIGKRSAELHARALRTAREIEAIDARSARWIAGDVLRELESPAARRRLARSAGR
jgi:3-methyladenine DNA glycosylase AlkD